jgi:predicted transposase/invertase (TIGR01784 family)
MDVYSLDEQKTVYNTEMQADKRNDLIKRSRYYQSLIDSSLLEPGSLNFNQLNNTYIIMICPFDLFHQGKYCYTFRSRCDEVPGMTLEDGAIRIFLNTKGTNNNEVSQELIDFLHYIESTDDNFAAEVESERIRKIHAFVRQIKASEEIGVKYMQRWEERILDREEGFEEGQKAGHETGLKEGRESGLKEGRDSGLKEGRETGLKEGRETGLKEGRETGLKEGRDSNLLANLKSLIANLGFTPEQAMDALSVPENEREKYLLLCGLTK